MCDLLRIFHAGVIFLLPCIDPMRLLIGVFLVGVLIAGSTIAESQKGITKDAADAAIRAAIASENTGNLL
jgi:hypothetical protein